MKKLIWCIIFVLIGVASTAQSRVQLLRDSVGFGGLNEYDLATFSKKLYLLRRHGGYIYTVDTGSGALQPFTHLDSVFGSNKRYDFLSYHFSSLNNRIPVALTVAQPNGYDVTYILSVSSSRKDTLFKLDPASYRFTVSDTLMWFSSGRSLYSTDLVHGANLIDSLKGANSKYSQLMAGHKGVYYMTKNTNTSTGFDSIFLFFNNGRNSRIISANPDPYHYYSTIGTLNGDFYFLEYSYFNIINNVILSKVSSTGNVTTVASIGQMGGVEQMSTSAGGGKIWMNMSFNNARGSTNIYSYTPNDTGIVKVTNYAYSNIAPISNYNVSPDSFFYYSVLDRVGSPLYNRPDTLYRFKTSGSTPQLYGIVKADLKGIQFADSAYELREENASFCNDTLLYQPFQKDSVWIGTNTGLAFTGLADSVTYKVGAMIKVDNKYFFLKEHAYTGNGAKYGLFKLIGCGMHQVQLGATETEYLKMSTIPNPSSGTFQVLHKDIDPTSKVQFISLEGRIIPIEIAIGTGVIEVKAFGLSTGIYIIQVSTKNRNYIQKIHIL